MIRLQLLSFPLVFVCLAVTSAAQTFQPKSIQFQGDPDYTDAELTASAGLKKGAVLTAAEMAAATKQLMDVGIFESISYTFNGQDLVFKILPVTALYPIKLENLPLVHDKALEDKLRASLPLYHGKVPTEGGLVDAVIKELQNELAAKGIQATITALPAEDMKMGKVTAVSFSITSPAVQVGEIQLEGYSADMELKAQQAASKFTGATYSTEGSVSQLETGLGNLYHEQGYLEATAHATAKTTPVVDSEGIHVPFSLKVEEGQQFKLAGIQLPPDSVVTQAVFDQQSGMHPGDIAAPEKVRDDCLFISRQYHNKGFMKAVVNATPTFDRTKATVNYAVSVEPGPAYSMGTLKVENASDDLRAEIVKAWPVPAGAPFNEGAIRGFTATQGVNPTLERIFAVVNLRYTLHMHDDVHTIDLDLRLEKKH